MNRKFFQIFLTLLWAAFAAWLIWRLAGTGIKYANGKFPTNFGDTIFTNQVWFVAHMAGGTIVLLLGPLQFISLVRDRFYKFHRTAGKIYIIASLISIGALFINILPMSECPSCRPSNYVVTILWLLSIIAAWLSIRIHDIDTHRAFMMRGFIFAAYFILVRTYGDAIMEYLPGERLDAGQYANSDWLTWVIPLMLLELYLFVERYLRLRRVND